MSQYNPYDQSSYSYNQYDNGDMDYGTPQQNYQFNPYPPPNEYEWNDDPIYYDPEQYNPPPTSTYELSEYAQQWLEQSLAEERELSINTNIQYDEPSVITHLPPPPESEEHNLQYLEQLQEQSREYLISLEALLLEASTTNPALYTRLCQMSIDALDTDRQLARLYLQTQERLLERDETERRKLDFLTFVDLIECKDDGTLNTFDSSVPLTPNTTSDSVTPFNQIDLIKPSTDPNSVFYVPPDEYEDNGIQYDLAIPLECDTLSTSVIPLFPDNIIVDDPFIFDTIIDDLDINDLVVADLVIDKLIIDDPIIDIPVIDNPTIDDHFCDDPVISDPVVFDNVIVDSIIDPPVINNIVITDYVIIEPVIDIPIKVNSIHVVQTLKPFHSGIDYVIDSIPFGLRNVDSPFIFCVVNLPHVLTCLELSFIFLKFYLLAMLNSYDMHRETQRLALLWYNYP